MENELTDRALELTLAVGTRKHRWVVSGSEGDSVWALEKLAPIITKTAREGFRYDFGIQ